MHFLIVKEIFTAYPEIFPSLCDSYFSSFFKLAFTELLSYGVLYPSKENTSFPTCINFM